MDSDSYHKTRFTLLEKIRDKHNDEAWADFAYYYRKYIYNIVVRMNLPHHDAEEIVQIVLLKCWDKLPEFQYDPNKGKFRGWLCRVTGNVVRNYFRDVKNRFTSLDAIEMEQITEPEIEKLADAEWEKYLPELAWKNISTNFQLNLKKTYLRLREGVKPVEIAKELGIAESSIYVYKKRIEDKMRAEISRLQEELG